MNPYQLEILNNTHWSEDLFELSFSRPKGFDYQAGQFISLFSDIHPKAKAYSLISHPNDKQLAIFFNRVPGGIFSNHLAEMKIGETISMMPRAGGIMTPTEIQPGRKLWLIATGTGLGPYLSLLQDQQIWEKFESIECLHGIRFFHEVSYLTQLLKFQNKSFKPFKLRYAVSREKGIKLPFNEADSIPVHLGRIPELLATLPKIDGISSEDQVVLCGNPDMVVHMQEQLEIQGLTRHRHRRPGHIHSEIYQ